MANQIILVVDDSKENLLFMETVLKSVDYQVRLAPTGKLALRALEHEKPDLVLLDINMPEMNGYEVCRKIKANEDFQSLPVVFLSGIAESFEEEQVALVGGAGLLAKPFGIKELLAMLKQFLD